MKTYQYKRYASGWHWSNSLNETIVYIPELEIIAFKSNSSFGMSKDKKFIKEANEYYNDIVNNRLSRFKKSEIEEWIKDGKISEGPNKKLIVNDKKLTMGYGTVPLISEFFDLMQYEKESLGGVIYDFQIVDMDITEQTVIRCLWEDQKKIDNIKKFEKEHEQAIEKTFKFEE